jgi:hypothetical protein
MATQTQLPAPALDLPALALNLPVLPAGSSDLAKWGLDPSKYSLASYDLPQWAVVPLLLAFRHVNTLADMMFYDTGLLTLRLWTRGVRVSTSNDAPAQAMRNSLAAMQAAMRLNLSALFNPEGAILVVDAHRAPFVHKHDDVETFLANPTFPADQGSPGDAVTAEPISVVTVTGVGSSALGSVAMAWNVSETLRQPVAAIVPGYGLADIIPQGLGGFFGFGVYEFMRRLSQELVSDLAPQWAKVGRHLSSSAYHAAAASGRNMYRTGSPESDILHEILLRCAAITRLYGHSKGSLCIQNAIRGLPAERYKDLHVTTFGAVIEEDTPADYNQILGSLDSLGQLNSWGNWPEQWIKTWHSTNTMLPLTMHLVDLVKQDVQDEAPVNVNEGQIREAIRSVLETELPKYLGQRLN